MVSHPRARPSTSTNEKIELFRLDKDISEKTDLAADHPDRAASMLKRIKAWYAGTQKTATPQPGGWIRKTAIDGSFFNGKDLKGWSASEMEYWSVKDGAIVGHSEAKVPGNKFLWSDPELKG